MRTSLKLFSLFIALIFIFPYPVSSGPNDDTGPISLAKNASVPVWSPSGNEILFVRDNSVTPGDPYYGLDIYKINTDGSKETQLTNFFYNEKDHIWSPDGTSILYSYDAVDDLYLYIMGSDGSDNFELKKQSYGEDFAGISGCVWSPAGSRIAFISHDETGPDRLVILNPDGSNERTIAGAAEILALAWSPDSSRIIFKARYSGEDRAGIYLMNSDGSGREFLAEGEIRQQVQPWQSEVWSPDGSKILYSSNEVGNSDIYVINTDGSRKTQLTDNSSEDYSPCFSPDGSNIVFISGRAGHNSLWIMDSNGDNEKELTENLEGIYDFSWSPDGQKIAFSSNFNAYIKEIPSDGTDGVESPDNSDQDTDEDPDYLHMEILSPKMNFAAVQETPELITVRVTSSSGNPVQGSGFKYIRANFSNGDPELQLFDDGTHLDVTAGDGVFSNQWIPVNSSTGAFPVFYILRISADHESLGFAEQSISGTISRKPVYPDLVIEEISWDPAEPSENDSITFRITSANNGFGPSGACTVKCYINGSEIYSYPLSGLEAGSNESVTFNWVQTASGNIDIKATVDTENKVYESDEGNNEKIMSLSVKSPSSSTSDSSTSDSSTSGKSGGKSSSGGSSGGGGAGGSPEPASNVRIKELSQQYITNGKHVKFTFPKNVTCVTYVEFDSKRTAGKTTTIVEMLKNKSARVSELPSGKVYENMNIWVGNKGTADPENIENAVIGFRVERNWINSNDVDPVSIRLWRFSSGEWEELSIRQSGEDDRYIYFEAKTPGFSSFAITALPVEAVEKAEEPSPIPSVRSADVMEALVGLTGKQNSDSLRISTIAVNESDSDPKTFPIAGETERIIGRKVLRAFAAIALLSVTGYLGFLIVRKQN
ncbi:PGF-pre-PGF domain-containing protein [Methanosarcina hadiensis]|uniref:PGF-pre-PGF domain-containing protein n=1 Tax=Methanosarcina hadiensis TaxID=3078083 RepID=UPI0039776EED